MLAPQIIKIELLYNPWSYFCVRIRTTNKTEVEFQINMCISIFVVSLFQIANRHEQPKFLMIIEYIMQSMFSLKK